MGRSIFVVASVVAAAVLTMSGCNEYCDANQPQKCMGKTVVSCQWEGDAPFRTLESSSFDCEIGCVEQGGQAFCTDSATPVDACLNVSDSAACWNGQETTCRNGFPTGTTSCGTGLTCAFSPICDGEVAQTVCAVSDVPDKDCIVDGPVCNGGNVAQCQCGFIVQMVTCPNSDCFGGECGGLGPDGGGFFGDGGVPDFAGEDPAQICAQSSGTAAVCNGSTGVDCQDGLPVDTITCSGSFCVVDDTGHAACD